MADKMMRLAGRSLGGQAKAVNADNEGRLSVNPSELSKRISETFSDSGNKTHVFRMNMDGFTISNDGSNDLTFEILGQVITVKSGEVFEGDFPFFRTVVISGSTEYRAYGSTSDYNNQQKVHYLIEDGVDFTASPSTFWKGTETVARKNIELDTFSAWGNNPTSFKVFKVNNGKLSNVLYEGNFTGSRDARGFKTHNITSKIAFAKGERFIIIVKYGSASSEVSGYRYAGRGNAADLNDGEYLDNGVLGIGETRYNSADEPQANQDISGGNMLVYNHRITLK